MKVIFCLLSEQGHINPYIGPAQALKKMGHEVLISSTGEISDQIKKSGLSFTNALVQPQSAAGPKGKALIELIENRKEHRALIEKFFLKGIREQVAPIQTWLKNERPDVLVIDPMNYSAIIAAELLKIPWVSMSSSLTSVISDEMKSDVLEIIESLAPARFEIFESFGLAPKFRAVDCLSSFLNISFTTKEFILDAPEDICLVGPSVPLSKRGDEVNVRKIPGDRPVIYVSFGSQVFHYPELFKKIREACKNLKLHLVMSIGDLKDDVSWEDEEFVHYYKYAPQLEILQAASLFITHGGANSVMESLRAGVPMLIHPLCNDQHHQAHFIEKSGVGRSLNLKNASAQEITKEILEILQDRKIKVDLEKVTKSYQRDGSAEAAKLIVQSL